MSGKHTAGSWHYGNTVDNGHLTIGNGSVIVAEIVPCGEDTESNARLIASALDLLAALEWISNRLERGGKAATSDAIQEARAAIAKAKGGAS